MSKHIPNLSTSTKKAATTERKLRRTWDKCTRAEGATALFKALLKAGVGVARDERYLRSEEGQRRAKGGHGKGKEKLRRSMTENKLQDAKKSGNLVRKKRAKLRKELENLLPVNVYKKKSLISRKYVWMFVRN
jgi:hypothetical protein